MITLHLLPFALLALRKHVEPAEAWKPSKREVDQLTKDLEGIEKKEVNGRMQYPFELYLEKKGVIAFGMFGETLVRGPLEYFKFQAINDLRKWINEQEMDKYFASNPEAREEHETKVQSWKKEIGDMLRGVNKNTLQHGIRG